MRIILLLLLFVLSLFNYITAQVPPVQGEVVFNTIDPYYVGSNKDEFVVLVNRTSKAIDLNGFEVQTFDKDGSTERSSYQWISSFIMQPYSFLLISTFTPVKGIARDLAFDQSKGNMDDNGYVTLRKQSPSQASDYIDVVKYSTGGPVYTGVPSNSGLPINNLYDVDVGDGDAPNLLATRGGVSGDINSLTYHFYYDPLDFTTQLASITPIQNASSSPLPVELSTFSAVVVKEGIKLNWKTETEVNNYGFEILRQAQYYNEWINIGFVNGNGNSNSPKDYSFIDDNVNEQKYNYRLKQIDNDGKYDFSKIVEVDLGVPGKFELSQNYPNPFNPVTTIKFTIPEAGNIKLTVFNLLGEEVATLVNESREAGVHTVNFDATKLNSGLYLYKITTDNFTELRKMMLLK